MIVSVVPLFMVQGGDLSDRGGSGGESIYGEQFEDENFEILHDIEGIVGMPNKGPNTNNSQFYITTVPCSHLDGINVAFGKVLKGLNILVEMANVPRESDTPLEPIVIENCGEIKAGESWAIGENDGTEDVFPPWPNDWDIKNSSDEKFIKDAIGKIKNSGNYYFGKKNYVDSERKYVKALRYVDWYISENGQTKSAAVEHLKINSLLNLALVRLKRSKFQEVVELCNFVIERTRNGKAFYRRAQARMALKDYDHALSDLNAAISMYPNDRNIQTLLSRAKKNKLKYLRKERNVYCNLFK